MIRLIKPSIAYKESFLEAVKEFHKEKRNQDIESEQSPKQFAEFVRKLKNQEKGIGLPKGYVPASTYWLVAEGNFIGKASIRHKLNKKLYREGGHIGYEIRPSERKRGFGKKILELAIKKTIKLDINKILVTCNDDNIGSWKIIEANGGILQNKIKDEDKLLRRYWIRVS